MDQPVGLRQVEEGFPPELHKPPRIESAKMPESGFVSQFISFPGMKIKRP
jgi:hypothetical protein